MPALLKNLMLDELSLVDRPANAQAMVSLFKRDDTQKDINKMDKEMKAKVKAYMAANNCSEEEAMKACGPKMQKDDNEQKIEDNTNNVKVEDTTKSELDVVKADLENAKAEIERLTKSLADNGYEVSAEAITKKQEVEMIEVSGVAVAKSDIPAVVLKALEDAAIEKADLLLTKRAEELLPNFSTPVAKTLVSKFADVQDVMAALKAADKLFEDKMSEVGKSGAEGDLMSATEKMNRLVVSHMEVAKMKPSEYAKAYAEVAKTAEGKTLINKIYKGE